MQKNRHLHTIASQKFVRLYLLNEGTYRQSQKNLLCNNTSQTSLQYRELRSTSGWDRFVSLGHPSYLQLVSCLDSVTAWHCSSGRQPNFAASNRGRHLYSAGRPSRWTLAHIVVLEFYRYLWCDETKESLTVRHWVLDDNFNTTQRVTDDRWTETRTEWRPCALLCRRAVKMQSNAVPGDV